MDQNPPPLPPHGMAAAAGYHQPMPVDEPWNRYETGAEAPTQPSQRRLPATAIVRTTGRTKVGGRIGAGKKGDVGTATWEDRFTQLALYKAQKGTCDVPVKEDPQLGRWVRTQRAQYRLRAEGKPSTMNDERVELLESIAFDWKLNSGRRGGPRARHRSWDEWYEELRTYHQQNGHCNVPQKDPSGLGLWVGKQRQNFKAWMAGESSPMTRERMTALEELGFQFNSLTPARMPWEERLEELKAYKAQHGNCRVRAGKVREGTFSSLGKWVDRQRQMKKLNDLGKKTALTEDRIRLLEEVGFEWSVPRGKEPNSSKPDGAAGASGAAAAAAAKATRGRPKKDGDSKSPGERKTQAQKWSDRFEELKEYKAAHGNTRVRAGKRKDGSYSQLGKWADHQRQLYRQRSEGKPSSMSDDRVQALESLGFQWVLQHRVDDVATPPPKKSTAPKSVREKEAQKEAILSTGKKQSQKWYDNFEALRDYKEKYGNCRVKAGKKKDSSYSKLGKWVDHQRQLYRARELGKSTSLTDERIAALDELDFEWVVVRRTGDAHDVHEAHETHVESAEETANAVAEEMVEEPHAVSV